MLGSSENDNLADAPSTNQKLKKLPCSAPQITLLHTNKMKYQKCSIRLRHEIRNKIISSAALFLMACSNSQPEPCDKFRVERAVRDADNALDSARKDIASEKFDRADASLKRVYEDAHRLRDKLPKAHEAIDDRGLEWVFAFSAQHEGKRKLATETRLSVANSYVSEIANLCRLNRPTQ